MSRLQQDLACWWLPGGFPAVRRLESVVDGVANEMGERCLQLLENVAVDAGVLAANFQPHLLAEGSAQVTDEPWKTADTVGERTHPADDYLVVQSAGKVFVATGEALEFLALLRESGEHGVGLLTEDVQHGGAWGGLLEITPLQSFVERRDRVAEFHLRPAERKKPVDDGTQLPRLDQRFAGESDQPIQAVGRYSHHPVDMFEGLRRSRCRNTGGGRLGQHGQP